MLILPQSLRQHKNRRRLTLLAALCVSSLSGFLVCKRCLDNRAGAIN